MQGIPYGRDVVHQAYHCALALHCVNADTSFKIPSDRAWSNLGGDLLSRLLGVRTKATSAARARAGEAGRKLQDLRTRLYWIPYIIRSRKTAALTFTPGIRQSLGPATHLVRQMSRSNEQSRDPDLLYVLSTDQGLHSSGYSRNVYQDEEEKTMKRKSRLLQRSESDH